MRIWASFHRRAVGRAGVSWLVGSQSAQAVLSGAFPAWSFASCDGGAARDQRTDRADPLRDCLLHDSVFVARLARGESGRKSVDYSPASHRCRGSNRHRFAPWPLAAGIAVGEAGYGSRSSIDRDRRFRLGWCASHFWIFTASVIHALRLGERAGLGGGFCHDRRVALRCGAGTPCDAPGAVVQQRAYRGSCTVDGAAPDDRRTHRLQHPGGLDGQSRAHICG